MWSALSISQTAAYMQSSTTMDKTKANNNKAKCTQLMSLRTDMVWQRLKQPLNRWAQSQHWCISKCPSSVDWPVSNGKKLPQLQKAYGVHLFTVSVYLLLLFSLRMLCWWASAIVLLLLFIFSADTDFRFFFFVFLDFELVFLGFFFFSCKVIKVC